ncbi:MAG: hypothetical protein K0V04_01210 [Deltaproteobacteria bacterium]|nr:hypothetical protein [Deltaproteobacteria bacterium]
MKPSIVLLSFLFASACAIESEPDDLPDTERQVLASTDHADACTPQACGPAPQFSLECDDGIMAGVGECIAVADGECGWKLNTCPADDLAAAEPEPTPILEPLPIPGGGCNPLQCGLKPDVIKLCPTGGFVGADVCSETSPGQCGWTFPPCPDPKPGSGPCGPFECGWFPPLVIDCNGLISHSAECVRQPDGLCQWQAPDCEGILE